MIRRGRVFGDRLLIIGIGFLAYHNSFAGSYVMDDIRFINDSHIGEPLQSDLAIRPLLACSLAFNWRIHGFDVWGYHSFNFSIHILTALTLYELVRRSLMQPRLQVHFAARERITAAIVAIIWVIHPLNTQAVTYIIQRCESMMSFFALAAMLGLLQANGSRHHRWWLALSCLLTALGTGCKESLAAFPLILLIYDRALLSGSFREALRLRWGYYLAVSLIILVSIVRLFSTGMITGSEASVGLGVEEFTPFTYALTQTGVILHYLRLTFYPVGLTLDAVDWPVTRRFSDSPFEIIAVAILVAVTIEGVVRNRLWAMPAAMFFLILAPTSSVVPLRDPMAEHRMYLPLAVLITLIVCGIVSWKELDFINRPIEAIILGLIAFLVCALAGFWLLTQTRSRNAEYCDPVKLYHGNVVLRPGNTRARGVYAELLWSNGEKSEAINQMRQAVTQSPSSRQINILFAQMLNESGLYEEALASCEKSIPLVSDAIDLHREAGIAALAISNYPAAVEHLNVVIQRQPDDLVARLHLGLAYLETERDKQARLLFKDLRQGHPIYPEYLLNLAKQASEDLKRNTLQYRMAYRYTLAVDAMHAADRCELLAVQVNLLILLNDFRNAEATAQQLVELAVQQKRPDYKISIWRQLRDRCQEKTRDAQP